MKRASRLAQQRAVGRILYERVLKQVGRMRRHALPEQQPGVDEITAPAAAQGKNAASNIDRLGDDPKVVLIRHHYVFALLWNVRYPEAAALQQETLLIANRLGDSRSKAYALAAEVIVSTIFAPKHRTNTRY